MLERASSGERLFRQTERATPTLFTKSSNCPCKRHERKIRHSKSPRKQRAMARHYRDLARICPDFVLSPTGQDSNAPPKERPRGSWEMDRMSELRAGDELDAADLRACGELLTDLHRSSRIASNAFVVRILRNRQTATVDAELLERLRTVVSEVLDELPSRQRTIVERCDFGNETRDVVAADLAISHRHFSRERREAHRRIAERLVRLETPPAKAIVLAADEGIRSQLRLSTVLENNGRWEESIALLESLAQNTDSPARRIDFELRMSNVYFKAERLSLAKHHVDVARTLVTRLDLMDRWREFQIDAALAHFLLISGEGDRSADLFHRCTTQLRSWSHQSANTDIALADALSLRALLHMGRNELSAAAHAASEARTSAERWPRIDPQIDFSTRWIDALGRHLETGNATQARDDYLQCYNDGIAQGLTLSTLSVTSLISATYRQQSQPEKAVAFLTPLVEIARTLTPSEASRGVFMELASAYIELGGFDQAQRYLRDLEQPILSDPWGLANAQLLAARAHFGLRRYDDALASAEAAEAIFIRVGRKRPLGSVLLVQAESLAAVGRYKQAYRVLSGVIEVLQNSGDTQRLARAYDLMATVSDEPRYAAQARKLRLQ
jgi:tetratricopeptide (TPR) repeat protein